MVHFIDEGIPVMQPEKMSVTLKAATPGFDVGNIKEFAIMSQTELSAGLGALSFDEVFTQVGREIAEELANLKLQGAIVPTAVGGAGGLYTFPGVDPIDITLALPIYCVYKSAFTRHTLSCLTVAPVAIAVGVVF